MTPTLRHVVVAFAGALISTTLVVGAGTWLKAYDKNEWVTTPLGLSLRLALQHPRTSPPTAPLKRKLHALGISAREDLKRCIAGVSDPPAEVVLVFDGGTVELASGPVNVHSDHGRCTAQVLEGLWGEVDGHHRLLVNLSLP